MKHLDALATAKETWHFFLTTGRVHDVGNYGESTVDLSTEPATVVVRERATGKQHTFTVKESWA